MKSTTNTFECENQVPLKFGCWPETVVRDDDRDEKEEDDSKGVIMTTADQDRADQDDKE